MIKFLSILATIFCFASAAMAANNATGTLTVSATILPSCTVTSGTLSFGPISNLNQNNDATGTFSVFCTNGTNYTLSLDAGAGSGATVALRKMTNTGPGVSSTLNYLIYTDTGRTTLWGDGTTGTSTKTGTGTGIVQLVTVYGRIPLGQTATAGSYTDIVNITLSY